MPECLREAVLYAPASTARYLSRTDIEIFCKTILNWILDARVCCDIAGERRQHRVSGGALVEDFVRRGLGENSLSAGPSWPMSCTGLRVSVFTVLTD